MPEDAAGSRCHGLEVERGQFGCVERGGCFVFQHNLASGRPAPHRPKPGPGVEREGPAVIGCHEQADAPAAGDACHLGDRGQDGGAAIALPLLPAIHRQPAEPPARAVPLVRVDDVEADGVAQSLDRHHCMGWSALDGCYDVGDGA